MLFGAYKNLMDPSYDPTCKRCDEDKDTVEHWLECPGTLAATHDIFGKTDISLDIMTEDPAGLIALASRTLQQGTH